MLGLHKDFTVEVPRALPMLLKKPRDTDSTWPKRQLPSRMGLLGHLPLELRIQIYQHLLVKPLDQYIPEPHLRLCTQKIMVVHYPGLDNLDSTILRTCKDIYHEALPMLYFDNLFHFERPDDIERFGHYGLASPPFPSLSFAGLPAGPYGRLALIRELELDICPIASPQDVVDREQIWSDWSGFFNHPDHSRPYLDFPALTDLFLGFYDWDLDEEADSQIRVEPFVRKFRPSGGLVGLGIKGVYHKQNIRDLKYGLVRKGGAFTTYDQDDNLLEKCIITTIDLNQVSKGVRDIVQKDNASKQDSSL